MMHVFIDNATGLMFGNSVTSKIIHKVLKFPKWQ